MSYSLEFTLKGLPPMSNQHLRMHWRTSHRATKDWKRKVNLAVCAQLPPEPLIKARLTLTRHSTKEPDWDGLTSGFKSVVDGLVEAKVLIDDKPSVIGQPKCLWEKAKRGESRITVKVEAV